LDCGQHVIQAPIDAFFTEINSTGRLVAWPEKQLAPVIEPDFMNYFAKPCDPQRYAELQRLVQGTPRNDDIGFNSALLLLDTALLGERNAALRGLFDLWKSYGAIASGDQPLLNLYFANYTSIPTFRPPQDSSVCYYSFYRWGSLPVGHPRSIDACMGSYLIYKHDSFLDYVGVNQDRRPTRSEPPKSTSATATAAVATSSVATAAVATAYPVLDEGQPIYFTHIPKAGGTSFVKNVLFQQARAGSRAMTAENAPPPNVARRAMLVTMLRRPRAHVVSLFMHCKYYSGEAWAGTGFIGTHFGGGAIHDDHLDADHFPTYNESGTEADVRGLEEWVDHALEQQTSESLEAPLEQPPQTAGVDSLHFDPLAYGCYVRAPPP
jgi:hypothetical protein